MEKTHSDVVMNTSPVPALVLCGTFGFIVVNGNGIGLRVRICSDVEAEFNRRQARRISRD